MAIRTVLRILSLGILNSGLRLPIFLALWYRRTMTIPVMPTLTPPTMLIVLMKSRRPIRKTIRGIMIIKSQDQSLVSLQSNMNSSRITTPLARKLVPIAKTAKTFPNINMQAPIELPSPTVAIWVVFVPVTPTTTKAKTMQISAGIRLPSRTAFLAFFSEVLSPH